MVKTNVLIEKLNSHAENNNTRVVIKDKCKLLKKLEIFISDGIDRLQFIADFDRTLSKYKVNGELNPTCHEIVNNNPDLSPEARSKYTELYQYYYPIEFDSKISINEKIPFINEWWIKTHALIVENRLNKENICKILNNNYVHLRDGVINFIKCLNQYNVPLLVFSAGIGNIIEEILNQRMILLDNVRIVSNYMEFDEHGFVKDFRGDVIHSFNKTVKSVNESVHYENVCSWRKNVILLGDSIGDPHMSHGLPDDNIIIKIGFLNSKIDDLLPLYEKLYDIVLINDETFKIPMDLLNAFL